MMINEMLYCDSCGNYVPVVEDEGSLVCGYEFAEYPEIATVLQQQFYQRRAGIFINGVPVSDKKKSIGVGILQALYFLSIAYSR